MKRYQKVEKYFHTNCIPLSFYKDSMKKTGFFFLRIDIFPKVCSFFIAGATKADSFESLSRINWIEKLSSKGTRKKILNSLKHLFSCCRRWRRWRSSRSQLLSKVKIKQFDLFSTFEMFQLRLEFLSLSLTTDIPSFGFNRLMSL